MKIKTTTYFFLAGLASFCAISALPAAAQSHGGGGRGAGTGVHAGGARVAQGGRRGGGWQRGGSAWWGPGLGLGWGDAYYLGYPYAWPPGYYAQYGPPAPMDTPFVQTLPPSYYAARPNSSATPNWYYCTSAGSYYPYVSQCPEAWRVVPIVPAGPMN